MSNGVVHVGSHKDEEVPQYVSEGRFPILCFDPQPLGVNTIAVALGEYDGSLELRIPYHLHGEGMNTMSASGFPLIEENAIANGWTPAECEIVTVPMRRFDSWAQENGFEKGSCSLLAIDVQGMELQVLRGFGEYLRDFQELKIECSNPPLYAGGAPATEIVEFVAALGFSQLSPIPRHGDIHFKKEK